jgi:hypothetical protein
MPETLYKPEQHVTTVMGMLHQFMAFEGGAEVFNHLSNTINNRRNHVLAGAAPLSGEFPKLRYFGLGIGGTNEGALVSGTELVQPYCPLAGNHDLFTPIPVRVVPVTADLSAGERASYRLRTRATYNDVEYYLYWLKVVDFSSGYSVQTIGQGGVISAFGFSDTSNTKLTEYDVTAAANTQIVVALTGALRWTKAELTEAINVIYAGNWRKGRITEVGLYTGVDRVVPVDEDAGIMEEYTDAAYVHLASHTCMQAIDVATAIDPIERRVKFENGSAFIV